MWGRLFHKTLSTVANVFSVFNTMDNSTEFFLKDITPLSFDTLKDEFFHFGGNISDLLDQKNQTVAVEFARRWGKDIIEEIARLIE